jgi:predicted transcriptional regulator
MRRSTSDRTWSTRISAAGDYPVTDNGHLVGLLPFRSVAAVPPREWSALQVRDRMIPAARALMVDTEDDLSDAVAALLQAQLRRALVAHGSDGVGPLSISDVYRLLELRKSAAGGQGQEAS